RVGDRPAAPPSRGRRAAERGPDDRRSPDRESECPVSTHDSDADPSDIDITGARTDAAQPEDPGAGAPSVPPAAAEDHSPAFGTGTEAAPWADGAVDAQGDASGDADRV